MKLRLRAGGMSVALTFPRRGVAEKYSSAHRGDRGVGRKGDETRGRRTRSSGGVVTQPFRRARFSLAPSRRVKP